MFEEASTAVSWFSKLMHSAVVGFLSQMESIFSTKSKGWRLEDSDRVQISYGFSICLAEKEDRSIRN